MWLRMGSARLRFLRMRPIRRLRMRVRMRSDDEMEDEVGYEARMKFDDEV